MSIEQIQNYFSGEAAVRMGQAVGLDPQVAGKALSLGLPLQIQLLRDAIQTPEGKQNILEAVQSIPHFASINEALDGKDGASQLQRAGEMVYAELFKDKSEEIAHTVTRQVGGSVGGISKLLNMSLPLLLSALGRLGLNSSNISPMLQGLNPELLKLDAPAQPSFNPAVAAGLTTAAATPDLIEWFKTQFIASNAEKIGQAAGFTNVNAVRAVQGILPVVLNAVANKATTEAGATDLLRLATPLSNLTHADGSLNTDILADSAEMARIEGQGRGLLAGLFSNIDELSGRLGTALGGSGSNASRLVALMTPFVLAVLAKQAQAKDGAALHTLLEETRPKISTLIPAGLPIAALLTPPTPPTSTQTISAQPEIKKVAPEPVVTPAPVVETTTVRQAAVTEEKKPVPFWIIPLVLALLGLGYWLMQPKPVTTTAPTGTTATLHTAAPAGSIVVENPQQGANLPPAPFTISGTAAPNDTLTIEDEGQEVAKASVNADGKWSAELPAPTPGEHTYRLMGATMDTKSEFKVNIVEGTEVAVVPFDILEPASGVEINTDGFNIAGRAPAGTYELFEDAVSLGTFTVADDGQFTVDVAAPTEGKHTYDVLGPNGKRYASIPLNVVAAAVDASCTDPLTLSLNDGENVSAPFRFGGHGSGTGVTVNVWRGDRQVGTQEIAISPTCTWSYKSDPGGQEDLIGDVRYEVIPQNADGVVDDMAKQSIQLKVAGSGTNFNEKGEYVGPQ